MKAKTQVFLSYKYHDENGKILPDYYMAKELYAALTAIGVNTFFSDDTIMKSGKSDYKRMIDDHLDDAEVLIIVSTSPKHCESNWVRYEWDSFFNDLLSGDRKGELISYLDTDNVRAFPRTIRSLQVFEKKNGLEPLLQFVRSYFHIPEKLPDAAPVMSGKGSSYNYESTYELGDERRRLEIQAGVESTHDCEYIAELLTDPDRVYNVLDVGCSMGKVTTTVFGPFEDRVRVIGIDKFQKCVDGFNESCPSNMKAYQVDAESDGWLERMREIMNEAGISGFDLVYCSLSLHHMSDSGTVIRQLWKLTEMNGYIYIRTLDDNLKLAYPNGEPIYKLIQMTAKIPRVSDRFHGRKVYSMLYKAFYRDIHMKSFLIDSAGKDINSRYALYYSAFVWRKNYFKNRLNSADTPEEIETAMEQYNEVMRLLDEIELMFADQSFYFGYYTTIAIAQKKRIFQM